MNRRKARQRNLGMGFELPAVFARVGLKREGFRAEAITSTKTAPHPIGAMVHAMLTRMLKQGVATEQQIRMESLAERLRLELEATDGVFISDIAFYGWASKLSAEPDVLSQRVHAGGNRRRNLNRGDIDAHTTFTAFLTCRNRTIGSYGFAGSL